MVDSKQSTEIDAFSAFLGGLPFFINKHCEKGKVYWINRGKENEHLVADCKETLENVLDQIFLKQVGIKF